MDSVRPGTISIRRDGSGQVPRQKRRHRRERRRNGRRKKTNLGLPSQHRRKAIIRRVTTNRLSTRSMRRKTSLQRVHGQLTHLHSVTSLRCATSGSATSTKIYLLQYYYLRRTRRLRFLMIINLLKVLIITYEMWLYTCAI